ncbi:hypothetical protein (plasmid) [Serratia marcescens]|uniref:Uncharacterized protein n=2 Tax=Serratia marcescens TaxID=615 RepID=A0A8X6JRK3_SERMA|nr:hypothetical protein [Serratia marcescens]BCG07187.1 hypothetical protein [Serratia marcescens]BCG07299.1 hypothetical protein [Serratia marcescens]BCT02718.1 hypothetical protein [Serratia marcescens]BCT02809.1 hypothetical protein [Serratia marcescens]
MKKLSEKMLDFALARPYMCLTLSIVFLFLCAAKGVEYMVNGRHLTPLLISILACAIGGLFFVYFYMRHTLAMSRTYNFLLNNRNSIAEGVAVDHLRALAKSHAVEKEFDDYFSSKKHPQKIEVFVNKISEFAMKKLKDNSRS